jgi:hypothetical protein
MESGSFCFSAATRFDPTRWKGQIKHFMKCTFLKHLPSQAINQDHIAGRGRADEACHFLG